MGIGKNLSLSVKEWGVLAIFIVIISIMLLKFSTNDSVACSTGYLYNSTYDVCCSSATSCASNLSVTDLPTTITTIVTAFSEPRNWVGIVIIAAIGIALLAYFNKSKGGM